MQKYRMPLSSYLNSKADIEAALIDLPDPEAWRKQTLITQQLGAIQSPAFYKIEQFAWNLVGGVSLPMRPDLFHPLMGTVAKSSSSSSSTNIKPSLSRRD